MKQSLKQNKKYNCVRLQNLQFCLYKRDIIKFPKQLDILSDDDYISLFMGIIKVIKEDTKKQILSEIKKER